MGLDHKNTAPFQVYYASPFQAYYKEQQDRNDTQNLHNLAGKL
ncbi:hypothetical protein KTT_59690 [Tengunoibacter tsumagoiensis]|uniref:Uncharacterized protein n=1 Tax=Tengunoibacter tsumagoiensis TaxID=2014871 RepID=A0A402AAE8_9CHLR|nr:hypothetical protein KTT_59690 [Tengunoibacter tsumagoiensis]